MIKEQLKNGLLKNSVWNILASIVIRGGVFFLNILIARILGVTDFGKYVLIKSTVQTFENSIGSAFNLSTTKFLSENEKDKEQTKKVIFTNICISLILSIIVFLIFIIFSKDISIWILKKEEFFKYLIIASFYFIFIGITQNFIGILKGQKKFKVIFRLNTLVSVLNLFIVTLLTSFFSLKGAIIALTLYGFFQFIIFGFEVIRKNNNLIKISRIDFDVIKKFNLPAILSGLGGPIAIWFVNLQLSNFSEDGFIELGIFNSSFLIFALIVFLPVSISDVVFPYMNTHFNENKDIKKMTYTNLIIVFCVSLIVSSVPFIFPRIILSFFGDDFIKGTEVLRMMCISAILSSMLVFLGKTLATINKMWQNLFFNYTWGVLLCFLSYFFIKEGALGIAKAYLTSYSILFIIQLLYVNFKINKK
ncbi:oligosaccharide flippase family protein [Aurantibacter sp.]|uniref:oligosaccharide flippase family protein n=1 Tax=Aurantibacter sp. TaxID=2807103 RepID=UPI0035C835D2